MNKKVLETFKNLLLDEKSKIVNSLRQDSDVDLDGDETDEIQGNLIAAIQSQLSSKNKSKLVLIDAALTKIREKTFGICEDCGEDIPEKRLSFNPCSSTCVGCAEDREAERKRK